MLPVQGNVYMLVADGTNITASVGPDGVALVNTGSAQMSDKVLAALNQLAKQPWLRQRRTPASARTVRAPGDGRVRISTRSSVRRPAQADPLHHQHQRGARARRRQREARRGGNSAFAGGGFGGAVGQRRDAGTDRRARERAQSDERAGGQTGGRAAGGAGRPTRYFDDFYKLPEYVNGEPVIVYHAPAANTDGDSFVFFRHSEVISAGNLFSTVSYPVIDVERAARFRA